MTTLSAIAVIDDDASVRTATDNLLSAHGYHVNTFASAEEFLRAAHLSEQACIVADVQMSGMSGLAMTLGSAWLLIGLVYGIILVNRRRAELAI